MSWFLEGSGEGPPVLLIQGTGVGGETWRPQISALAEHYDCLCFDNRGFGGSQPLAGALSLETMADDALALMDAQGWKSAHVMGHSLGGLIALYLAHKARGRVRSLSLLCTFASGAVPTRLTPWMIGVGLRTKLGTRAMRRAAFLKLILAPSELEKEVDKAALAEKLAALFEHDLADQPSISMKQLRAMGRADATPFLAALSQIPTLVVSAEHDRIAPPSAGQAIAKGIVGARYVEFANASHAVPILRAAEVNSLLIEHLAQAEKAWASVASSLPLQPT